VLCAAATRLAAEHGPAACTARAIATEAGLPLAAVSYYFPDLSVLVGEAVHRVCARWREHATHVARGYSGARPGPGGHAGLADAISRAMLPPGGGSGAAPVDGDARIRPGRSAVVSRYRHLLAAADSPAVTAEMAALRADLVAVVSGMLPRPDTRAADLLVTVVDGAALGAVAEGDPDPAGRVETAVRAALDRLR
jgi:AcrR family transcriptional regulator